MNDAVNREDVIVVGAGLMGTGIAHAFATAGFTTLIIDVDEAALDKASSAIGAILDGGVDLGKVKPEVREAAIARISTATGIPSQSDAQLLIETATESLSLKWDIMRQADAALPAEALIGTNTSALSVTEIGSVLANPGRLVGMHFFNPVHKMKLVELVRGLATSSESIQRARGFVERLGKQAIVVNDTPGLTTSRISALLGNEAMTMLMEGVASAEDIDSALRLGFNHPMGPLELGDLTGWDTRLAVLEYLHRTLGEKYRPCPLISKMVKAGRTGRKSGAGVYVYEDGKRVPGSGLKVTAG